MRKAEFTIGIMLMALIIVSCNDNKQGQENENGQGPEMMDESNGQMDMEGMDHGGMMEGNQETSEVTAIIDHYLELKNALVAEDSEKAATAGRMVFNALEQLDRSSIAEAQQQEVEDIVVDAMEHAEHIAESDIGHQREHFQILSIDLSDLVAITGTDRTLYQAYCPMYNEGGIWLSTTEEIKNPYFGSKMLKCGEVQEVIQ